MIWELWLEVLNPKNNSTTDELLIKRFLVVRVVEHKSTSFQVQVGCRIEILRTQYLLVLRKTVLIVRCLCKNCALEKGLGQLPAS